MAAKLQAVRGMNDLLPGETEYWQKLEADVADVLASYGYRQIRTPVVEKTELFKRSIGEVTDIVEKEMYTFEDRNGDSLTLRPEGTASTVRAGLQHGLFHNQVQRLWYAGPMFRHERPQKGRYRQFHQIGVEAFGMAGPEADAEIILLSARIWQRMGLKNLRLELNSLGTPQSRALYRDRLVAYYNAHASQLDEDSQRRLRSNPLRILDSKNPAMQALNAGAPSLHDYLDEESRAHFAALRAHLDAAGVAYTVNPRLVRGLDYYTKTVFEWMTDDLGAQGTVCAGGRYDGLVEQLGGRATPACGFGMGLERLVLLLMNQNPAPDHHVPDIYLVWHGAGAAQAAMQVAEESRNAGFRVLFDGNGGSFKSQFKRADKSGARFALVLGEQELQDDKVVVKDLTRGEQNTVARDKYIQTLSAQAGANQ